MSAAQSTKEVLDIVGEAGKSTVDYLGGGVDAALSATKSLIEAATPIAQKAYEIGLLTIRIDAAADILSNLLWIIFGIVVLFFSYKFGVKNIKKCSEDGDDPFGWGLLTVVLLAIGVPILIVGITHLFNLWLWVKLFAPDLWLAKQAILGATNLITK